MKDTDLEFISYAYGQNHFERDADLQAVLRHFWSDYADHVEELRDFGAYAGCEVYESVYHIDHDAPPVLVAHDLDGNRVDRVRLSPSEQAVLQATTRAIRPPYEGGSWHHHYALLYLLADPGLGCVLTITGQTVYALHKYAAPSGGPASLANEEHAAMEPHFTEWQAQLLDGVAFGATWFTESQGGSDLGANETEAVQRDGVWLLTGEKYFASGAGLADYAIVTARLDGARSGPKGLSLFLLPRLNRAGALNYHVRRLKDKSATRAVPSGEVELVDSEAYLIGKAEEGIYYTLENLNVSRLANSVAAMATGKKAHLEVLGRVVHRHSFGKALVEHPLIRRDLTDLAVRSAGGLALAFHAIDKFDHAWSVRPPYTPAYHHARFLTHLAKNRTANHAAAMTALGMELFGGLGFLEEYAVARWHREALITPIWEGPSNIQALDFLETLHKQRAHESFLAEMVPLLESVGTAESALALQVMEQTLTHLVSLPSEQAQWHAKFGLQKVADAAQVALLYDLAKDQGGRYEKLAQLYARHFLGNEEYPDWALKDSAVWGDGGNA